MFAHLGTFPLYDVTAVGLTLLAWFCIGWFSENPPRALPSVTVLMEAYRRDWMRTFVTRQPRIFDATVIESLRQGTAFFASASMIAIGGGLALIGSPGALVRLAGELTLAAETATIHIKILLTVGFLADALLKFIWSNRLFGYCSILMAAVPNDPDDPDTFPRAAQAAEINITAARNFNRGLRSIYFSLAALCWLIGPVGLMVGTALATGVMLRREFASQSREVILRHTGS